MLGNNALLLVKPSTVSLGVFLLQLIYLTVSSEYVDGVRIITVRDRFIIQNHMSKAISFSTIVSPISTERVQLEQVYKQARQLDKSEAKGLTELSLTSGFITKPCSAALFLAFCKTDSKGG